VIDFLPGGTSMPIEDTDAPMKRFASGAVASPVKGVDPSPVSAPGAPPCIPNPGVETKQLNATTIVRSTMPARDGFIGSFL
jgi:hypothetical protein